MLDICFAEIFDGPPRVINGKAKRAIIREQITCLGSPTARSSLHTRAKRWLINSYELFWRTVRTYKVTIIRTSPLRAYHTSPPIREKINYSRTRNSGREGNERRLRSRKRERDREKDASRAKLSAVENASSCRCINVITEAPDVPPPFPLSFFHHLLPVFRMDPAHFTTRALSLS